MGTPIGDYGGSILSDPYHTSWPPRPWIHRSERPLSHIGPAHRLFSSVQPLSHIVPSHRILDPTFNRTPMRIAILQKSYPGASGSASGLRPACLRPASGLRPACLRLLPAAANWPSTPLEASDDSGCGLLPPALLPAASGCSKLAFDPSGYGLLHIDSGMKVTKVTVSEATLFKSGPEMDSCI